MPTHRSASLSPPVKPSITRLDSCSLGRPIHLLPQLAEELREALNQSLRQHWNRRYQTRYEIVSAQFRAFEPRSAQPGAAGRWLQSRDAQEPLACMIERRLVLHMLAHRLGLQQSTEAAPDAPETATEERLLHALARSIAERSLRCLRMQEATAESSEASALSGWLSVTTPRTSPGAWRLELDLQAPDLASTRIQLVLDGALMDRVLRALSARQTSKRAARKEAPAQPLGRRLQLNLKARLLESQLPLSMVLGLRPGTLIPVHLDHATVEVEGAPLFHAQIAEHQGKLCLTSFQDME
ncbi:MAG: FliM/FliN family flagellar motor switch protein [Paucibacter sp.]|nr:FliM/FliN family flagellar motor switch protein [Roseateles sp.]